LRVLDIFEAAGGPNDGRVAITLHNLANQAMACHRPTDALRHATRALEITTADEIPDGDDTIATVTLIARARRSLGDIDGALATWDDVLARRHAMTPDDHGSIGWAELEAAITASTNGPTARARAHIARALDHMARSTDTMPREHARVHIVAARLSADPTAAARHLQQAWAALPDAADPRESTARLDLGATWLALGGPALAPWEAIAHR
jgi:hypothetical protein